MLPAPHPPRAESEETRLRERLRLARGWLFISLGYGALVALTVGGFGRSHTVYWSMLAGGAAAAASVFWWARLPLDAYGLTCRDPLGSLARAGGTTAVLLLAGFAALAVLRATGAIDPATPWFERRLDGQLAAYVIVSAPLQEVVYRGAFQGAARAVFTGCAPHVVTRYAVGFSTLAFSAIHLAWGWPVALAMVLPGIVWGYQAERDGTLLGVALSHAVVGYVFVGATPLWDYLRA